MESYLYYKRGDEWVRVNADRYSREQVTIGGEYPPVPGGQCVATYRVKVRRSSRLSGPGPIETVDIAGPIEERVGPYTGPENDRRRVHGLFDRFNRNRIGSNNEELINPITFIWISVDRKDGLPDNCGDGPGSETECHTKFYKDDSLVLSLSSCPEVTSGRGCSECCQELLPMIRSLHI